MDLANQLDKKRGKVRPTPKGTTEILLDLITLTLINDLII